MRSHLVIDDPISDVKLKFVCIDVAERWLKVKQEFWEINELQLKVTQGLRSYAEQWAIFSQGRKKDPNGQWIIFDKKKIVTNARGGESFHNFGLALDSAFCGNDPFLEKYSKDDRDFLWSEYGRLCEKYGLEWGGSWKVPDRPHAQRTYGLSLSSLQMIYEEKGTKGVYQKCAQIMGCGKETLV
jgi:hypothetical protein